MFRFISYFINLVLFVICALVVYIFFIQTPPKLSIWQGHTSKERTVISVLSKKDQKLAYFIEEINSEKSILISKKEEIYPVYQVQNEYSDDVIDHILLVDLDPQFSYRFIVKDRIKVIDERVFNTLDLDQPSLTFAVASCMDDYWEYNEQMNMWEDLLSFNPQMVFLIGDNVYADKHILSVSVKNFWNRYIHTIETLALYKTDRLVPILAIWDDHDYGMNDGHREFKHKTQMQKIFRDFFFLQPDEEYLFSGYGVSFFLKTKYQKFFFMDNRSFKSPLPQGSLWGDNQEKWLIHYLSEGNVPNWIINGTQFFGRHQPFESFERNFPDNFKVVMKKIADVENPVIFLSGDRHLSELQKITKTLPYTTYEITTSPIHATTYPENKKIFPEPDRYIYHIPSQLNYAIIKSKGENKKLIVQVDVYGEKKFSLFSKKLIVHKQ